MKNIMMIIAFAFLTTHAFANQEHETGMEAHPGEARIAQTRACFTQLEQNGCGRPADNRDHFASCALDRKADLDAECRALVKKLYQ